MNFYNTDDAGGDQPAAIDVPDVLGILGILGMPDILDLLKREI